MENEKNDAAGRGQSLLRSGLSAVAIPFLPASCGPSKKDSTGILERSGESFEFAFLTDIHIKPEMNAPKGFQMAIDKVNELNPDFVITGGDLVYDTMRG